MPEGEMKNEKPDKILKIVEETLEFGKKIQKLPITYPIKSRK